MCLLRGIFGWGFQLDSDMVLCDPLQSLTASHPSDHPGPARNSNDGLAR